MSAFNWDAWMERAWPYLTGYAPIWEERARHLVIHALEHGACGLPGLLCDVHVQWVRDHLLDLRWWLSDPKMLNDVDEAESFLVDDTATLLWRTRDWWLYGEPGSGGGWR